MNIVFWFWKDIECFRKKLKFCILIKKIVMYINCIYILNFVNILLNKCNRKIYIEIENGSL